MRSATKLVTRLNVNLLTSKQRLNVKSSDHTGSTKGKITGVGVGPGNPKHLTLMALESIRAADIVIAPCSNPDTESRAESIVKQVIPELVCQRILFEMTAGESGIQARKRTAKLAAQNIVPILQSGENVVFLTLGDPNIFSTFSTVANEILSIDDSIEIETIPGIMAFQAVASHSNVELLNETEKLFLVTAFEGTQDVKNALEHQNAAVVIYKGGKHLGEIKAELKKLNRLGNATVGELIGLSGERICRLNDIEESEISYLATVIVPPVRYHSERKPQTMTHKEKEKA